MLTNNLRHHYFYFAPVRVALFLLIALLLLVVAVRSQGTDKRNTPVWQNYKGITIGMAAEEVRAKLGSAKTDDAEGFFYIFSDTENAQFLLDKNAKVRTIMIAYSPEHIACPTFPEVFGNSISPAPKDDGSIFKMVRYEIAGFWISYNRMSGEKAMVMVTIQKI